MKAFILISVLLVMGLSLSMMAKAECELNETELNSDAKILCYGFQKHTNLKYIEVLEGKDKGQLLVSEVNCQNQKKETYLTPYFGESGMVLNLSQGIFPRYNHIDIDVSRSLIISQSGQYSILEEEDFPFDPCKPFSKISPITCIEK